MNRQLKKFKSSYLNQVLDLIWRQWTALGVAGYSKSEDRRVIDPEALLLFTCSMGRYEPRLFDEVLDWLDLNGRFINIQRLKTILKKENFQGKDVLAAIAGIMSRRAAMRKWGRLAQKKSGDREEEDLFFKKDGEPMEAYGELDPHFKEYGLRRGPLEFRGYSKPPPAAAPQSLIYKLRSLFGVNARCEIMLYLLAHSSGHPSRVARETYYYQKTVQDTLVDMTFSGLVKVLTKGREKHYRLEREQWGMLLPATGEFPGWITWAPLYSALERIWRKLNQPQLLSLDPLLQSSELRKLIGEVKPDVQRAGLAELLSDASAYPGEEYIPVFISDMKELVK